MMRLAGTLSHWNDARGFGFIVGADGERYFVHISSVARMATRPRHGDTVTFLPASGHDGRPEAVRVRIDGANPINREAVRDRGRRADAPRLGWQLVAAGILAGLLAISIALGNAPLWFAGSYIGMGAASFLLYRADKAAATAGMWRTSEVTLLAVDLCFGVVGGLLAQHTYRHKTRKPGYVMTAMFLTAAHTIWLAALASGRIDMGKVAGLIRAVTAMWT